MAEQFELRQLAETELLRLQRQLRIMRNDSKFLIHEKQTYLEKQRKLTLWVRSDHGKLKSRFNLYQDARFKKEKMENEQKLEKIARQYESLMRSVKQEKASLWELEGLFKKIEKKIKTLQKNKMTDICYKAAFIKIEKNVATLENRLNVVKKRCGVVLADNRKLRKYIDHMLQARSHFNYMSHRINHSFEQGKMNITDLIDQSIQAFDQREELCDKLQVLREKSESDKIFHTQEMRELQRKLEHDAKLHQFYYAKGQKRVNTELEIREENKKIQQKQDFENKMNGYYKISSRIKVLSKEESIQNLASHYTTQEEENFALFNYVNELSHEIEVLSDVVHKISTDIEEKMIFEKEYQSKRETETISHLESKKSSLLSQAKSNKDEKDVINWELKQLLEAVGYIFRLIRHDDVPTLNVLGTKNSLTISNVSLFLEVIGRRINSVVRRLDKDEPRSKILAKKERIPKFNVKDYLRVKS